MPMPMLKCESFCNAAFARIEYLFSRSTSANAQQVCPSCNQCSPRVYSMQDFCLVPECKRFWPGKQKILLYLRQTLTAQDGQLREEQTAYDTEFLRLKQVPPHIISHDITPKHPMCRKDIKMGSFSAGQNTRGYQCEKCGCLNVRCAYLI